MMFPYEVNLLVTALVISVGAAVALVGIFGVGPCIVGFAVLGSIVGPLIVLLSIMLAVAFGPFFIVIFAVGFLITCLSFGSITIYVVCWKWREKPTKNKKRNKATRGFARE